VVAGQLRRIMKNNKKKRNIKKGFKHEALFNTIQLKVKEKYSGLVERFNENVNDYNELLEENKSLKSKISDLKRDVILIYEITKELIKERTDGLKDFKIVFNGFVVKIMEYI